MGVLLCARAEGTYRVSKASCIVSCISDWGMVFSQMEADNITVWAEMQTMNGVVRESKHCLTRICHS